MAIQIWIQYTGRRRFGNCVKKYMKYYYMSIQENLLFTAGIIYMQFIFKMLEIINSRP
jgi:hypothetical protein